MRTHMHARKHIIIISPHMHCVLHRLNDDTIMLSPGWTDVFIGTLARYNPSNVGVVGPQHGVGNNDILTYDFTHKTHITIFGFYYPRY